MITLDAHSAQFTNYTPLEQPRNLRSIDDRVNDILGSSLP
jgi:hypothetical protein